MAYRDSSQSSDWVQKLKYFDAFPKQREEAAEFFHRSVSGGIITIIAAFFMTILFFSELGILVQIKTTNELRVDTSRGETMQIHFDVTFPRLPCSWISIDAMDVSGEFHLEIDHHVYKARLDSSGRELEEHDIRLHKVGPSEHRPKDAANDTKKCGSCYGAENTDRPCCATCNDVKEAYHARGWTIPSYDSIEQCKGQEYYQEVKEERGEGCRVWGDLEINKVAGNIHFAPGRSYQQGAMHIHDLTPFAGEDTFDLSHDIRKMAFGQEYPGMKNPLDGLSVKQRDLPHLHDEQNIPSGGTFQYFLKVVPTTYTTLSNSTISSNQYSVTEHFKEPIAGPSRELPGVFFFYDLSPIKVNYKEEKRPFMVFLTSACAIIGGVFTVSGIIDATWYAGQKAIRKKRELGKLI